MKDFAEDSRADFIPNGGEDLKWEIETVLWEFTTELENYDNTSKIL